MTTINDLVSARDMFSVDNISYDAIGNIKTLTRQGAAVINGTLTKGDIDVLSYSYFDEGTPAFSSQLKSVSDVANITELKSVGFSDGGALATASYGYSANGSMEGDPYRGLTLEYNHLDLPSEITTPDGLMTIIYDATGRKWLQKTNDGSRMYVGGIELYKIEKDGENYTVEAAATAGGRLVYDPEGGKDGTGEIYPEYHHRDHLGNTRVAFTDRNEDGKVEVLGPNNEVTQQLDYYPFGMAHDVECLFEIGDGTNRYRYNGKELVEDIGLYDYGARWYDPAIARWGQVDPKADLQESVSAFTYCLNSPTAYIDPDGSLPILINGYTTKHRGKESYWVGEILNTIANSGIANPGGQRHFVDGNLGVSYSFAIVEGQRVATPNSITKGVMSSASSPAARTDAGRLAAEQQFDQILKKLERDPDSGLITENIQIYSHSRGGAFAAGFTERLLELIEENSDQFANPNNVIDFGLHLAPHQSNAITAANGVDNYSISHPFDPLSGDDMKNSTNFYIGGLNAAHGSGSFSEEVGLFLESLQKSNGDKDGTISTFIKKAQAAGATITVQ